MTRRPPTRAGGWRIACLSTLLALPHHGHAETLRLSDLWLAQQALPEPAAYSYFLLERQQQAEQRRARRLHEELTTLIDWHDLSGRTDLARGLEAWQATIDELQSAPARTPARADLAALLAAPRHDPMLASLAAVGHCDVPDWVELWHFGGVTRHQWAPELSLRDVLNKQADSQWARADEAWLITPQGAPRRIGVAAWNASDAPLVPGTRIALALAEPVQEAAWVNRALPGFLATRLPGDTCHTIAVPEAAGQVDSGGPAT
ncbi:capsule biosynthesis GfcC family protein [Billgrantia antri]|uniref:Capsule biosynthesis GfcC family protein n=1 Tax=Billgrantia antri TaxID=2846777 RepID=A0ABS6ZPE0_9GAMM|nr:capsule biosynthesis GfcC family protein [Halomonas antri]MBW6391936.1 capsule biosynthesis GfcC family protein [Halomonas antri]